MGSDVDRSAGPAVQWAREIARRVLSEALPDRWAHTQGVAEQARTVGPVLGWDTDTVEAAAWLHDIGYAPDLAATGLHPLDGARYLRDVEAADPRLCLLVANHSGAVGEARQRGLAEPLEAEFPVTTDAEARLVTAVTYCDLTTGPLGDRVSPEARVAEIFSRYGPGTPVHRAVTVSAPALLVECRKITAAFDAARGS
jgi:hypothetical protein